MMTTKYLIEGMRVVLKANKKEKWKEESGILIEIADQKQYKGMLIVQLDKKHRTFQDDGIREVHVSQIKKGELK